MMQVPTLRSTVIIRATTMYSFFTWLEASALSDWVRSSPSMFAFPFILILHTVGMAFLVGANIAIDLRILGFAAGIPLSTLEKFFPVMWFGFVVNAVSGLLLLIGYPTKALTNPVFYLKLILIAVALTETWVMRNQVLRRENSNGRLLAGTSIVLWAGAVTAGRLLAYTYRHLMAGG